MIMIRRAVTSRLPTDYGEFQLHAYLEERDNNQDRVHLALVKGVVETGPPPLVRVHSECLTGEVLLNPLVLIILKPKLADVKSTPFKLPRPS